VLDSERHRIFNDWLAGHQGILFKVVHAYAFEHADRQAAGARWLNGEVRSGASIRTIWRTMHRLALRNDAVEPRAGGRRERLEGA
jgi:hypothetical protein